MAVGLQLWVRPSDSLENSAEAEVPSDSRIYGRLLFLTADVGEQKGSRHHQGRRAVQSTPEKRVSSCPLQPAAEQAPVDIVKVIGPDGPCSGAG